MLEDTMLMLPEKNITIMWTNKKNLTKQQKKNKAISWYGLEWDVGWEEPENTG